MGTKKFMNNNPKGGPPETLFKPGQVTNPIGGRAHNPAVKALRKLTIETYREVIELVVSGKIAELKAMIENRDTPALQIGIAVAFMKAIKNGDYDIIEKIAARIVGKIPEELIVNSRNFNTNVNVGLNNEQLKAAIAKLESDI